MLPSRFASGARALPTMLAVASLLIFVAGCSKDLSRDRAADLITRHAEFKSTYDTTLPVGRFWYDWRMIKDFDLQPLAATGILTFKETGRSYAMWWKEYAVELTPAGRTESKSWIKTDEKVQSFLGPPSQDAIVFRIPLAQRRLVEVTGVASDSTGKQAQVEFTWKWEPTSQAKLRPKKLPTDAVHRGAAMCQLYDDGWRIIGLQLL